MELAESNSIEMLDAPIEGSLQSSPRLDHAPVRPGFKQGKARLMDTSGSNVDLRECLRQAKDGNQSAAEQLISQIYPVVIRIVRRNLTRRDSEEDVLQEIFARIFSSLKTYKEVAPFEHWVSRIAFNACMNRFRAERARPEWRWADLPEAQADALDAVTSGKSLHPDEELSVRDLVDHILKSLAPQDRIIMRLLEMDGMTVKEVSSRTGWSGTFIRVRAFRARQKLNRKFSELWKRGDYERTESGIKEIAVGC